MQYFASILMYFVGNKSLALELSTINQVILKTFRSIQIGEFLNNVGVSHCVECVQIWSFFWSVFSRNLD